MLPAAPSSPPPCRFGNGAALVALPGLLATLAAAFFPHGADENTPLQIGTTLYSCTPQNLVTALAADTGKAIWKFDPKAHTAEPVTCRGAGYHDIDQDARAAAPRRRPLTAGRHAADALVSTVDARLFALDAATGRKVWKARLPVAAVAAPRV